MFKPLRFCAVLCAFSISMLLSLPTVVSAQPTINSAAQDIPKDTIIASWQPNKTTLSSISDAEALLTASRFLSSSGNERQQVTQFVNNIRLSQASDQGQQFSLHGAQLERLIILEAKLLQGVHKFDDALQHLNSIDTSRSAAAQLLLADISIQQGNGEKAKQHCEQLIGKTSFLLAFGCVLNADFSITPTLDVYNKLQKFEDYASTPSSAATKEAEYIWYKETLASMALTLNKPELAIQHLSEFDVAKLPISAIITWADANLAIAQYATITSTLGREVRDLARLDDALLLRWVKAQKALNKNNTSEMQLLSERMKIRAWREDSSHAAQVASYYLEIDYQPQLALKFARLNWQYAQTKHDEQLLKRAENAALELNNIDKNSQNSTAEAKHISSVSELPVSKQIMFRTSLFQTSPAQFS